MRIKAIKFSLSLFVCIFTTVLTVLSFVLALSGAWFTSTKQATDNPPSVTFGSVALGENFGAYLIENMLPTQTITYCGTMVNEVPQNIQYLGTVDAYYRISFLIENSDIDDNASDFE